MDSNCLVVKHLERDQIGAWFCWRTPNPKFTVWISDFRFWILGSGFWFGFSHRSSLAAPNRAARIWDSDFGFRILLDASFWMLDFAIVAKVWILHKIYQTTPTGVGAFIYLLYVFICSCIYFSLYVYIYINMYIWLWQLCLSRVSWIILFILRTAFDSCSFQKPSDAWKPLSPASLNP